MGGTFFRGAEHNLAIRIDLREVDSKLKNRTRSSAYTDICEEHTAFRVVLLWLWRTWIMHIAEEATLNQIPAYVRMSLGPFEGNELRPCPLCQAGTCTIMTDLPARLSKLIGEQVSTAKVSSKPPGEAKGSVAAKAKAPAKGDGATPPVARPAKGDGATAPVAHASGVCCCCLSGNAKNQSGIWICQYCGDTDMVVATSKHKVPSAMPMVASGNRSLPVHLGTTRATCDGGPGWQSIKIPGNGDCLFSSMAIGKLCLLQGKAVP